jgi:hypothetical protein
MSTASLGRWAASSANVCGVHAGPRENSSIAREFVAVAHRSTLDAKDGAMTRDSFDDARGTVESRRTARDASA